MTGAVALFAGGDLAGCPLADRPPPPRLARGRPVGVVVTILAAVAMLARGVFLGRPVTGGHAAVRGYHGDKGLAMRVLFSAPLGSVVIATADSVLMWHQLGRGLSRHTPASLRARRVTHVTHWHHSRSSH